jgi:gliding motility-associated-like protein
MNPMNTRTMKTMIQHISLLLACVLVTIAVSAQTLLPVQVYDDAKRAGTLPVNARPIASPLDVKNYKDKIVAQGQMKKGGGQPGSNCGYWQDPNGCPLSQAPNDDGSSLQINLPFTFNLYGQTYTSCYINNNGNLTFDIPWGTFSAQPFPNAQFVMVAPFWADVDTRLGGEVFYCISDHAMFVNWIDVGYFPQMNDKINNFQVIITDGTDPFIGVGNNVAFSYEDMQWTTGSASGGVDGFGGTPAVVGANLGDGVSSIMIGQFDHAGVDYDGPFGVADGVSWLDYKDFIFSTEVPSANIAPIISGNIVCDTLVVCSGELVDVLVSFFAPEIDQTASPSFTAPTLPQFIPLITPGNVGTILGSFVPTDGDIGLHTITLSGTDNGTPPLTQTATVTIQVIPSPGEPPFISGDTLICPGEGAVLTVTEGFDQYIWNNGYFGSTVLVGAGEYFVEASNAGCSLVSNTLTIEETQLPVPMIQGATASCGGIPATLNTSEPYATYNWSNGSQDPTITVGTGTYSVTVVDDNGCQGASASVNVISANDPVALFTSDNLPTVFPGTGIQYTNQSTIDGGTITGYSWFVDSTFAGNGTTADYVFANPGQYNVTLTVTTSQGCTSTYTYVQTVIPTEIIVPNVFSPNGDGKNDVLEFSGVEYYPNSSLQVFNRWGNEVFASASYKNTWRAPDVSEGTYYYVLKVSNGKEYTGHVTLLR